MVMDRLPRFLLSLYLLVGKFPVPHYLAGSFDDGLSWCLQKLSQHNIAPPETLPAPPLL
jgi:hypothetical protein